MNTFSFPRGDSRRWKTGRNREERRAEEHPKQKLPLSVKKLCVTSTKFQLSEVGVRTKARMDSAEGGGERRRYCGGVTRSGQCGIVFPQRGTGLRRYPAHLVCLRKSFMKVPVIQGALGLPFGKFFLTDQMRERTSDPRN